LTSGNSGLSLFHNAELTSLLFFMLRPTQHTSSAMTRFC
jgi:hypothetical protein